MDRVAHLSKVHQDQVPVNIDHLECNFTVVPLDHRVRDLLVAHPDTLVDLLGIQEELNHVLNGIDRQAQEARLQDMVDRHKDLRKDRQVAQHLTSIQLSFRKDHLISIPVNIHRDLLVHLMDHLMDHLMVLLMVLLTVLLMDNHMDRRMCRHMVTGHLVHKHLTEHPVLIIVRKVRLR